MPYGPCNICGATNYPSSLGGSYICPSCDCGNFNKKDDKMGDHFSCQKGKFEQRERLDRNKHMKDEENLKDRLDKAEEFLHRVLNYNQLSPGEWMSLVLDIVGFKPKSK
jgi:hypothetical protein